MWRSALRYSAVGLEMGVATGLGVLLGVWLDKKFGIQPWGTLGGVLLGVATGFRGVIRAAMEWKRQEAANDLEENADGATSEDKQQSPGVGRQDGDLR